MQQFQLRACRRHPTVPRLSRSAPPYRSASASAEQRERTEWRATGRRIAPFLWGNCHTVHSTHSAAGSGVRPPGATSWHSGIAQVPSEPDDNLALTCLIRRLAANPSTNPLHFFSSHALRKRLGKKGLRWRKLGKEVHMANLRQFWITFFIFFLYSYLNFVCLEVFLFLFVKEKLRELIVYWDSIINNRCVLRDVS